MTTTRIIQRVFVAQPGDDTLPSVTLDYAWSGFMNTYAVWPANSGDSVTIRRNITVQAGNYYVTGAVDNYGSVSINGNNISLYGFGSGISRTATGNNTVVYHPGGTMSIVIQATNTGGPRGVAVTISEYKRDTINTQSPAEIYRDGVRNTLGPPYVGALVWSTRSPGTATFGRYQVTMPFRANITASAWGAGGGGGGLPPEGGGGSPGLYNTTSFIVDRGDLLEVFVGLGGGPATPTVARQGSTAGGPGGSSVTNIGSDATKSFNGGAGGRAGPGGWSGAGGGGGGASGVLVNNVPVIVAGGGGGGGGGGSYQESGSPRQQGSISNNANGASGTDYRGESGSSKGVNQGSSDGGGGGGGGGGYPGGRGGGTPDGDRPGLAGQCGGNFPVRTPLPGEIKSYNGVTYSLGGAPTNGTGGPGIVILQIEPLSLMSVKVSDAWKQINDAFVKVGGNWKEIYTVYIKIDDVWREINGAGQGDVTLAGNSQSYGTSTRSFS